MELTEQEFDKLTKFIYKNCGIVIKNEKKYLIHQRLEPVVQSCGCNSFSEFCSKIAHNCTRHLQDQIIAAITTNETSFFRDEHPFEAFKDYILPEIGKVIMDRKNRQNQRKGSTARIWSAASSTGQEPYCLAMLINEYVQANRYKGIMISDFEIMATDISSKVLARAISGEFEEIEVARGLRPAQRDKYFVKEGGKWLINECIRDMVEFRRLNLMEPFCMLGGFDIIFCRNVLIYFDDVSKRRIFDQFHHMLADYGFLVLGASESTFGLTDKFESVKHSQTILYRKRI